LVSVARVVAQRPESRIAGTLLSGIEVIIRLTDDTHWSASLIGAELIGSAFCATMAAP
jgi:hypothetical protein